MKKNDFNGRLNTHGLTVLRDKMRTDCGDNQKKLRKSGYQHIDVWYQIAEQREKGSNKGAMMMKTNEDDDSCVIAQEPPVQRQNILL